MSVIARIAVLAVLVLGSGCGVMVGTIVDTGLNTAAYPFKEYLSAGAYKYDNTWDDPYKDISTNRDKGEVLLGLCISGGGSRSAYFLACALEELANTPISPGSEKSVLDELDFISSVSGGSLAAAYYCLERFKPGSENESKEDFFKRFKADMAIDFESRALIRLIFGFALLEFFTYHDRGDLLAEIWDSAFFGGRTFQDLADYEKRGAPVLLINGTCTSNSMKFVFTTIPDQRLNASLCFGRLAKDGLIRYYSSESYRPFQTLGFRSLNSDIGRYPVSKAVAASASVPNLIGPVTLEAKREAPEPGLVTFPEGYLVNVADGGVYDNYGVETVTQAITEQLDKKPGQEARILVLDSSGYFEIDEPKPGDNFSVAYWSERPLTVSWLRSKSYMEYVLQRIPAMQPAPGVKPYRNLRYELLSLYDVLPSQKRENYYPLGVRDPALKTVFRPDLAATEFFKQVTSIQTRFMIREEDQEAIRASLKNTMGRLRSEPRWRR